VTRAAVKVEEAGVPAVAVLAPGFEGISRAVAQALDHPLRTAVFPTVITSESDESFRAKTLETVVPQLISGLTGEASGDASNGTAREYTLHDVVAAGTLDEIQELFVTEGWSDGLPVIPPTRERVREFLAFTERAPDEVLGVLPPATRQATVWNVAVNGVMAGCRPEYMPILLAIVECLADPELHVTRFTSTTGSEPLVTVSGPLARELDFNCGQGVMRVGRRANTSVGRFTRLYLRNVAGLRIPPGETDGPSDKGTIGLGFNPVLAEDEEAVRELGWPSYGADCGFSDSTTVVTVHGVCGISIPIFSSGGTPEQHLRTIAELVTRAIGPMIIGSADNQTWHPLVVLSPSVASALAAGGYDKDAIRRHLYDHCWITAGEVERFGDAAGVPFSFAEAVSRGLPAHYHESDDPDRLVRLCVTEEGTRIVVAGDPHRDQSRVYVPHSSISPTSRAVELPLT
jgi:hypothetical protein